MSKKSLLSAKSGHSAMEADWQILSVPDLADKNPVKPDKVLDDGVSYFWVHQKSVQSPPRKIQFHSLPHNYQKKLAGRVSPCHIAPDILWNILHSTADIPPELLVVECHPHCHRACPIYERIRDRQHYDRVPDVEFRFSLHPRRVSPGRDDGLRLELASGQALG